MEPSIVMPVIQKQECDKEIQKVFKPIEDTELSEKLKQAKLEVDKYSSRLKYIAWFKIVAFGILALGSVFHGLNSRKIAEKMLRPQSGRYSYHQTSENSGW